MTAFDFFIGRSSFRRCDISQATVFFVQSCKVALSWFRGSLQRRVTLPRLVLRWRKNNEWRVIRIRQLTLVQGAEVYIQCSALCLSHRNLTANV